MACPSFRMPPEADGTARFRDGLQTSRPGASARPGTSPANRQPKSATFHPLSWCVNLKNIDRTKGRKTRSVNQSALQSGRPKSRTRPSGRPHRRRQSRCSGGRPFQPADEQGTARNWPPEAPAGHNASRLIRHASSSGHINRTDRSIRMILRYARPEKHHLYRHRLSGCEREPCLLFSGNMAKAETRYTGSMVRLRFRTPSPSAENGSRKGPHSTKERLFRHRE